MGRADRAEVRERLADYEKADQRRLWESAVKPLAIDPNRRVDPGTIPGEMVIARFEALERAVSELRRDLGGQVAALRRKGRRSLGMAAMLVITTSALTLGLTWLACSFARGPSAAEAAPVAEDPLP